MDKPTTIHEFESFERLPAEVQTEILLRSSQQDLFRAYMSSKHIKALIDNDTTLSNKLGPLYFKDLLPNLNNAIEKDLSSIFEHPDEWQSHLIALEMFNPEYPEDSVVFMFVGTMSVDDMSVSFDMAGLGSFEETIFTKDSSGRLIKSLTTKPIISKYNVHFRKDQRNVSYTETPMIVYNHIMNIDGKEHYLYKESYSFDEIWETWSFGSITDLSVKLGLGEITKPIRIPYFWTVDDVKFPVIVIETEADMRGFTTMMKTGN